MTEQSAQHGAAIDDALKNGRRQSSAGTRHHERSEDDPTGATQATLHSEIARFLGPAAFPGDAEHIRMVAADNDATDDVRGLLARLPAGRRYATVADVVDALGA